GGFFTSLAISLLAIPSIVTVAQSKGLYDKPQGRTPESKNVPTLGGLAIFAGMMISLSLFADISLLPEMPYLVAGAVVLFFIGIKDDILIIAPWWKLLGQVLVTMAVSILGGLRIQTLNGFLGIYETGDILGVFITVLIMVALINSFNLIDGIDGLASGIGILSSIVFGLIFWHAGLYVWTLMAVALCGSLIGFTWYNVFGRKKKIYMGDTGSLLLGFFQAVILIRFLNLEQASILGIQIHTRLAFALAVLIIPVFDIVRIIIIRLMQGRSPFQPDRQHIHYRMVDMRLSHLGATGILMGINLAMISIAMVMQGTGEIPVILFLLVLSTLLSFIPGYYIRKEKRNSSL
ncbi:glycosyltransferase family 4 protein, partial [Bacteroidota bacterium]